MAGGRNNKIKQDGISVRSALNHLYCHNNHHHKNKINQSRSFKHQILKESKFLYEQHVNLLQKDIKRIFYKSLHYDLKIIYEYKVVHTNQCIIRIRSPWLYSVLKPYFSYENNTAYCCIKQFEIFQQITNFVRLLYTNSDIPYYEHFLIQFILNASNSSFDNINKSSQRKLVRDKAAYYMSCHLFGNVIANNVNVESSISSDMADSGMETGSMTSPQETVSESSSTDLDEPNESKIIKRRNEIIPISDESHLTEESLNENGLLNEAGQIRDEISEYESRVLSEPFHELQDESDDDVPTNSYLPTKSPEFTETESIFVKCKNIRKCDETISQSSITVEQEIDVKDSCTSNNYYFIDASSLNDDIDIATTNVVGYPNDFNGKLSWSNPQMPSSCYIPTSRSNNFFLNNDSFKFPSRKIMNVQNPYEEVVKLDQEPKIGKLDSLVVQDDLASCKNANKESLVVEIKEADSGESTQHSPCPDNTKIDNLQKAQDKLAEVGSEQKQHQEDDAEPKPVLIRRNTFELDANDEKLSSLRQEYERRQGKLVFQNSITQYSQHRIDGDSYFEAAAQPDEEIIDNLNLKSDSQINIANACDYELDSCNVNSTKEESNPLRRLSNVDSKTFVHSITRSASDKLLTDCDADEDDISYNSLPISINNDYNRSQPRCKLRRNEAAPIVSGGASSSDFQKPTDSPIVKRKTESTPIVSGGSIIVSESEIKEKSKVRSSNISSSMTAWVVDMSDCTNNSIFEKRSKQSQQTMSTSFSPLTNSSKQEETENEKEKTQHSSLGYFVNLDDIKSPKERPKETLSKHRRRTSDTASEKNYCEFFIDISDKSTNKSSSKLNDKLTNKRPESLISPIVSSTTEKSTMASSQSTDSKKNIFSMFIDLNEPASVKPKTKLRQETEEINRPSHQVTKSSSSSKLSDKQQQYERSELSEASEEPTSASEKKPKSGIFMFIESDSPLVRRRTLSSSRPAFKRHSWNTDKSQEQLQQPVPSEQINNFSSKRVHKRAHSLSVDRVGDFRKFLAANRKSDSNHSLNEAASKLDLSCTSSNSSTSLQPTQEQQRGGQTEQQFLHRLEPKDDTFDYDMRDTPPNSHVEIINEELLMSLKSRTYQELDAINEQTVKEINKISEKSETNEINESNETSQKTNDTNESKERTKSVQQDDGCGSESSVWEKTPTETSERRKSETFDISSSASGPSSTSDNLDFKLPDFLDTTQHKLEITRTARTRQDNKLRLHNIEKTTKNNSRIPPPASFVRLSDLDKRPLLNSTSTGVLATTSQENSYRLSNSVTETSWIENKLVTSARSMDPSLRSITKKIPLSNPNGTIKSDNFDEFGFEGDAEAVISESDLSSLHSSMGRSGQGSTEETETSSFAIGKPQNKLGEDLLRMFLEEINPDVTIDVGGRRIKAHKCILSSRCQYFAAILSGGWIESAGNIISLQGYSYSAVHFALCHIYSGESCIPDSISIVELATLADMLCLEGLKEVIGFTLKVKYCHLFHKPCNGCSVGVLECMPLAAAYGLDEVYRKSLRWVTRHFVRIWPTKEFATLPRELMDKCYHQHIVHMCADNVLQTIMDCNKLLTTLPNVRWAEPVFRLVSNLLDVSMKYLTDNFTSVLGNESFLSLDRDLTWNISRLEDHLLAAAERLPPEQACKVYSKVDKMFAGTHTDESQHTKIEWSSLFANLMNKIRGQVEKCLIRDAARAARTNAWLKMDLELRRRIQELACLVILPNEVSAKRPSRHSNFLKEPKERQEAKTPLNHTPLNRSVDLRKVKMAITEHNDKTLNKQTPLLQTRKIMIKPQTDPLERKLQNKKLSDISNVSRPKSWPNKIEVKSRYLEPRNRPSKESVVQLTQEKTLGQPRRKIMISSSDSSRTSSPAMKRAAEKKAVLKISKVPIKKEGRALSSDSLTDTSSRLNLKKEGTSKSCGITRPESPLLKAKDIEAGLSVDSLADTKKRPLAKKTGKMDTSMSTDSLMTDVTTITTPKSVTTNKSSPILGKTNTNIHQIRNYDKLKKSALPTQQRNTSVPAAGTPSLMRRPARSLESSTAASRSRAAAVVNTYHGSLNLRKSLLDAAKAPDIPSRVLNSPAMNRTALRQNSYSMRSSFAASSKTEKCDRKEEPTTNNQRSSSSPLSKRSPKSNINSRLNKSNFTPSKQKASKLEDKPSNKTKSQTTSGPGRDAPKFLNQSSRSGTFLKDEPTILNKSDIETAAIDV